MLQKIHQKISEASRRSPHQKNQDIRLIAVTKGQPVEKIEAAIDAGQRIFGDNYAQELLSHAAALVSHPSLDWHFIGHLQRNKVKKILPIVSLIHSVDSLELAQEINRVAALLGKTQPILIEVNIAAEENKSGLPQDRVESLVREMVPLPHIHLQGLMTLPPLSANAEDSRPYFKNLREIRDGINRKNVYKSPLRELSMGMTQDFEIAIEEGATLIRIGTGIFGERRQKRIENRST